MYRILSYKNSNREMPLVCLGALSARVVTEAPELQITITFPLAPFERSLKQCHLNNLVTSQHRYIVSSQHPC